MALSAANAEALNDLCRLLRFSQGEFALVLAQCNSSRQRQRLIEQLRQDCPVGFAEITLAADTDSLFKTVRQQVGQPPPQALMVYGLGSVRDSQRLLSATNQIREEFRQFEFPVVLWLTDDDLKQLLKQAPDFYTWANPVSFETPPELYLEFIDDLSQNIWQQVLQSQENHFLSPQELGLASRSTKHRELAASLTALEELGIELPPLQQAGLAFVQGRMVSNSSDQARQHYEDSLAQYEALSEPDAQAKVGHVQFYLGLWWRNHAERQRQDFESACQQACDYYAAAVDTFARLCQPEPISEYINYWAEALHRLGYWDELDTVARRAQKLHQKRQIPFRLARATGFLAEVALVRSDWKTAQQRAETALRLIQPLAAEPSNGADLQRWVNHFHRAWYLFSLGKAQLEQDRPEDAIRQFTTACTIMEPDYDPQLYSQVLEHLRRAYFRQGEYLQAFETRRRRDAIESRFNYRAFIGAGRLQPRRQVTNPALPAGDSADVIVASGRKHDVKRLVKRIAADEYVLTIIYGPSGVGKSSLIEAGLAPALCQERYGTRRAVPIYLRHYHSWIDDLSKELGEVTAGPVAPDQVLDQLHQRTQANQVMVLIFDQFEEFFFEFEQVKDRQWFYEFLGRCLAMPYVKVVLSLREDYIHYLLEWDRLTDLGIIDNNILDKKWLYYLGNFDLADTQTVFADLTGPTPYNPEPEMVEQVVTDLAAGSQQVRPIELQIVGAQLQAEKITTLEEYLSWGDPEHPTKELLVQKYLTDIVDECGPQEHQDLAELVLYLLTNEQGTRPFKTKTELADDLKTLMNQPAVDKELLGLVLNILTRSGLVMEVPEVPEDRYQLVHDYLSEFVRSLQQPLVAKIEEERQARITAEQRQIEEQQRRLESERRQRKQAQRAAMGLGAVAAAAVIAGGVARAQWIRAARGEVNAELLAESLAMEAYLASGLEREAMLKAVEMGQTLETDNIVRRNHFRAVSAIRQVSYGVQEKDRLIGHNDRVWSVAFSPDGNTIASASADNTVKLWSKDGQELSTLSGHNDRVWSVAFSPDGNTIASASEDNTVKTWSKDGQELSTLSGHNDRVLSVAFSPDGNTIASASADKTVKTWSKDGQELSTLAGHNDRVLSVTFSPDGNTIASASEDNTVKLWSKDGQELSTLAGHNNWVASVAFSPDGNTIASASVDNTVKLWSKDGQELNTLAGHNDWVASVAFSPDGNTIASASADKTVRLWNFDLQELTRRNCQWLDSYLLKQLPERLIDLDICAVYNPTWPQQAAPALVSKADNAASTGNTAQAIEWYKQALEWDDSLMFNPRKRAQELAENTPEDEELK